MQNSSLSEVNQTVATNTSTHWWKRLFAFIGPAYLVSVGYMDPGNWATDIAAGSKFGYQLIWVLLMSNLMAILLQSLSARLGLIRGVDLAQASRETFPKFINIPLYILAEIAIAACDLAEVIGMAIGLNLLFHLPLIWGIGITILDTFLLLFLLNRGIRKLEAFIFSLVLIIAVSFFLEILIVKPVVSEIIYGFIPSTINGEALYIAIGIIGATVMPHNLYLHSSLVQTRIIIRNEKNLWQALKYNLIDSTIALNLAFFVNASILIVASAAFFKAGYNNIAEIQDAHQLLRHIFGKAAPALFAIALIAAGQSSTVTGTLAGQIIMEGYLSLRIRPWLRRMLTRLLAIIPAVVCVLFFGENNLGRLLIFSQVILSIQLGFAIVPLIHFVSDKKRMGVFTIKLWMKILSWLVAIIILTLNIKLVLEQMHEWIVTAGEYTLYIYWIVIPVLVLCAFVLVYIVLVPLVKSSLERETRTPHESIKGLDFTSAVHYQKIAVTVDFGKMDQKTISGALKQGGLQASYYLIHVVESANARIYGKEAGDFETQADIRNLQRYADELNLQGFHTETKIGFGNPRETIAQIVNELETDLLVMGAHGHSGLYDLLLGDTVDKVRHAVKIPVLIVK
ncbi:MAG: Nramp family divalent metal transporter [Bacteroidetes bacterium]|nr:Nramp family divalent metal transporter [Bacteroidota bacterium]